MRCSITKEDKHCNGTPVFAHHLTLLKTESRMGGKAGDEWLVPLCALHHNALHFVGEKAFWIGWKWKLEDVVEMAVNIYLESKFKKPKLELV